MNNKRFAIMTIVAFAFVMAFDMLVHGILFEDMYEQTKHLWRTEEEMKSMCVLIMGVSLLFTALLGFIFTRNYEGKGLAEGVRFGVYFGLIMGLISVMWYAMLPISMTMAGIWFASDFVKMVVVGIIFAFIYRD